jgi:hypothetical protein
VIDCWEQWERQNASPHAWHLPTARTPHPPAFSHTAPVMAGTLRTPSVRGIPTGLAQTGDAVEQRDERLGDGGADLLVHL